MAAGERNFGNMDLAVDMDVELTYWRSALPATEIAAAALEFSSFIPTIRFGYECYSLYHHHSLAEVLPVLKVRYDMVVPASEQLDWRWADQIIRHSWGRMLSA
ncbi:MAG: hypothetical protein ABWY48_02485 [Pseudoxanthomonas sp.]